MRFTIGFIAGILIAALCIGAYRSYCYCRDNPGAAERGMANVEKGWQMTKSAVDSAIETAKPYAVSPGNAQDKQ